jgi:Uma2 family endonuclease
MVTHLERQNPPRQRLFTIEEYERMIEAGVFHEDEHIELIRGAVVKMAALGLPHEACVRRLTQLFVQRVGEVAIVSVQNSVHLPTSNSQPEPDVALLKWREDFYETERPQPTDVLLLVEVAESSLRSDRVDKVPLYAEAGISEFWLIDLRHNSVEVYTNPEAGLYRNMQRVERGGTLTIHGKTEVIIEVDDILGKTLKKS